MKEGKTVDKSILEEARERFEELVAKNKRNGKMLVSFVLRCLLSSLMKKQTGRPVSPAKPVIGSSG
ncbi:MAG: hypothetical protein A4E57_04574 [Syntrophorhabdaceae bacterium PtaU1.Bin034]|jgi:hypothetical protein|nr:MAG: hypothetical protein A4E57_04574 [Syntrophorhabdaceae bacterium PtaU1.Bin034]